MNKEQIKQEAQRIVEKYYNGIQIINESEDKDYANHCAELEVQSSIDLMELNLKYTEEQSKFQKGAVITSFKSLSIGFKEQINNLKQIKAQIEKL